MASCEIKFNKQGEKVGVEKQNELFQEIFSIPHIQDFDGALNIFTNVYGKEGNLSYTTDKETTHDTFQEAILNSNEIVNITFEGEKIAEINTSVNTNTEIGVVNGLIKEKVLSAKSYKEQGKNIFVAKGETEVVKTTNALSAMDVMKQYLGASAVKKTTDGGIYVLEENKRTNVEFDGKIMPLSEVEGTTTETKAVVDANNIFKQITSKARGVLSFGKENILPENELQERLFNLLQKFGVKTIALEDYKGKESVPKNAKALADLTDKIIALSLNEGQVNEDELLEEVGHFIESSIPMKEKENILRNIHNTEEWRQFAEEYQKIYATDKEVRREILGKIIGNSIKEQFNERQNNPIENSIIRSIKNWVQNFINNITARLKPEYLQELETLKKNIYQKFISEQLELNPMEGGLMFSTENASSNSTRLQNIVQKIYDDIRQTEYEMSKNTINTANNILLSQAKAILEKDISNAQKLVALSNLIRVTSSQVNTIIKSATEKTRGDYPLSAEENVVLNHFKIIRPALLEAKSMLGDSRIEKEMSSEIDVISLNIDRANQIVAASREDCFDKQVEKFMKNNFNEKDNDENDSIKEEYKELLKSALRGTQKDTDFFHSQLGSLLMAKNPLLNMAGDIIERMNLQSIGLFQKNFKPLMDKIGKLTNSEWNQIITKDFEIINEIDAKKSKEYDEKIKKQVINELLTQKDNDGNLIHKELEGKESIDEVTSIKTIEAYESAYKKKYKERFVSYWSKEFLDEMNSHTLQTDTGVLRMNEISDFVKEAESVYRAEIFQIQQRANGNLTESDKAKIRDIEKQRKELSNPRDEDGEIKKGLEEIYDTKLQRFRIVVNYDLVDAINKEEINRIYQMNNLSLLKQDFFRKKANERGMSNQFITELEALPKEERMNFLINNAYISFSDDYFKKQGENDTISKKLTDLIADENTNDDIKFEALLIRDSIRKNQSIVNNIIRGASVYNKPGETNYYELSGNQKNIIRQAQEELEKEYSRAKNILPVQEDKESGSETLMNDSYYKYLKDNNIENDLEARLKFILQNVTANNYSQIITAKKIYDARKDNPILKTKTLQNVYKNGITADALLQYAESKTLPYLKKSEPIGFSELMNGFENGSVSVQELMNSNLVRITPAFSYYENQEGSGINPEWVENKKNKKEQYTKEYLKAVENTEFNNFLKNKKLREAREALLEYYDKMIEFNNMTGRQSRYMLPGVRKTDSKRWLDLKNGNIKEGLKEIIKDKIDYRPEEQEIGRKGALDKIPTYYTQRLDNMEEQTTDFLYAFAKYGEAATLHKARRDNISDMYVLSDVIRTANRDSVNTIKMFESFMDYNFYGKKVSREFKIGRLNVGKILQMLNGFAKLGNLAGITVPITSALQSATQKFMERVIGEKIDSSSANLGNKLFAKYYGDSAKEAMGFESKSVINVIGEALGVYSITHRFENSQYSKAGRLFVNLSSKLHELGNFPVIQRAMLSQIASYRYVDGKIISYNKFVQKKKAEGFTGNIKTEWEKNESFVYDFIDSVKDGVLDFENDAWVEKVAKKLTNVEAGEVKEYLQQKKEEISKKTLAFIQDIDSQIPQHQKSMASRDAVITFFLSHLNWLLSAIPRKLRSRHYDRSLESFQEGSWITAYRFAKNILFDPKGIKKIYADLDNNQKKNIKRTLVELGFANALAIVGMLLTRMEDDDDDPIYLLSLANMFANRVAVEQIGSTVGLPSAILGVFDNPLMLKTKAYQWVQIQQLFEDDNRNQYLKNILPFYKDFGRFYDPQRTRQTYMHFAEDEKGLYDKYAWLSNFFDEE